MMSEDSSETGTDNRPPILEESDYESWKIHIEWYIKGKTHEKLIWKSILNGPSTHHQITDPVPTGSPAEHALKKHKKQEQSSNVVDPLAYLVKTTHQQAPTHSTTTSPSQLTPAFASTSSSTAQSHDDAMLATMKQIANLLSGFQKQFPPTNNPLRSSSNTGTHATVHNGQITTESVQRRAPGNHNNGQGVNNKKVICYNCRGEGHVSRQCKEPNRPKDSLWHQDKAMLLQAKENGAVLDAKAEAFLADVECTVPLAEPLTLTTTNMFQVNHEDAYDLDVDDEPNAAAAFMANISSSSSQINEVRIFNDNIFETVSLSWPSEPTLYDGHRLLQPGHALVTVSDSHETLLETEVSRMKMSQKPGHVTPVDYTKLNALYDQFVPQKELSREQVYWISTYDIASQSSDPPKPVTPFVHTRPMNSENDGYKIKIANHTRRYLKLSKASTHSHNTSNEKIAALNAEIAKMKPSGSGTKVSRPKTPENPKVLAPGMYAIRLTPAAEVSKPQFMRENQKFRVLPTKNENARRVEDHPRNLNKRNNVNSSLNDKRFGYVKNAVCGACNKCLVSFTHDNCYVHSMNAMHAKKPQVARPKTIPKNVRKTDITVAYRIVPQWKPTDRQFILCDIYGPKKSKAPTAKPLELSLSVSSSSPINVISRLSDSQLRHVCVFAGSTDCSMLTPAFAFTSSSTAQSHDDAILATIKQIANLLSGFRKQFSLTNNQLMSLSNTGTHATVHDGQITTESL
nr:hypothetical protein [Tanacetum cinerariifolium]